MIKEKLPFHAGDLAGKLAGLRATAGDCFAQIDEGERVPGLLGQQESTGLITRSVMATLG